MSESPGRQFLSTTANVIGQTVTHVRKLWRATVRHPIVTSITPIGWTLIIGGLITARVGWGAGWLEFRAIAVMCAVVMLIAILTVLRRSEHDVLLELHQPRVQVGEEALGRVVVRAAGGRRSTAANMAFKVGQATATFRVGSLAVDDEHEEMFAIPTRRRGIITVGPVTSVQADPVGAISRNKILTEQHEFFIHPKITHVQTGAIGFMKDIEGVTTTNLSSSDVSFHALREYQPGDDRRAVHWKTSARTGKLMVRQFEETMRAHMVIALSTRAEDYASADDFELAVSAAGSLCVAGIREERQVSVLTSREELQFLGPLGLLDKLAGVELAEQGSDHRALAVRANSISGMSVAAFITGNTGASDLRAAQLALHNGVVSFAVRCDTTLTASRRQVGDLTVLDVPELAELPGAVGSLR